MNNEILISLSKKQESIQNTKDIKELLDYYLLFLYFILKKLRNMTVLIFLNNTYKSKFQILLKHILIFLS